MSAGAALEVVRRDVLVDGRLDDVDDPGRRIVAEVGHGHGRGRVDGGQQPEEDDGEEAEDGEEDEDAAGVNDGADEEQQAEEGEQSWKQKHFFTSLFPNSALISALMLAGS